LDCIHVALRARVETSSDGLAFRFHAQSDLSSLDWTDGFIRKKGHPETGIPPGTAWSSVSEHWVCPKCGVGKNDFSQIWLDQMPETECRNTETV